MCMQELLQAINITINIFADIRINENKVGNENKIALNFQVFANKRFG